MRAGGKTDRAKEGKLVRELGWLEVDAGDVRVVDPAVGIEEGDVRDVNVVKLTGADDQALIGLDRTVEDVSG